MLDHIMWAKTSQNPLCFNLAGSCFIVYKHKAKKYLHIAICIKRMNMLDFAQQDRKNNTAIITCQFILVTFYNFIEIQMRKFPFKTNN